MDKIRFIINPISGNGKKNCIKELIKQVITLPYEICTTNGPNDATRLAKECNCSVIVAVGGDGTVNEVGKALIGTDKSLGIIPTGSGNGLARHCNIPLNPSKALELINQKHTIQIDTGTMNEIPFLNVAGVGFDGHIANKFAHYGKRGFLAYAFLVLKQFFKYKSEMYQVNGITQKAFLISFANSSQYGNNIRIAPEANLQDGLLDVVFLKDFPLKSLPQLSYHLLSSNFNKYKFVEITHQSVVVIKAKEMEAHIDGEPIHFQNEVRVKIHPGSLNLIAPLH